MSTLFIIFYLPSRPVRMMKFRGRPFVKRNMDRYKTAEAPDPEDGYGGHIDWDPLDNEHVLMMAQFREYCIMGNYKQIANTIADIAPDENADYIDQLAGLCMKRKDAESIKEALLIAICIGSRPIVEFILTLFHEFPTEERSGCANSTSFPPHMTPLMLASILNNFSIVECLLLRGHSLNVPHRFLCGCALCLSISNSNVYTFQRIDAFRALASDAYLWLGSMDPFVAAASLAHDIEVAMEEDRLEFIDIYRQLYTNVQHFTLRMVEQCWKVEEIDVFLSNRSYSDLSTSAKAYPRIRMALDCSLRNFVASAPVQQAAEAIWYSSWGNFGSSPSRDSFRILRHVFLYPLLSILYIVSNGTIASSFNVPLARYISFFSSYATFLICLVGIRFVKFQTAKYDRDISDNLVQLAMEAYVFAYVLGMMLERYLEFSRRGFRNYFSLWWRWFDFVLLGLFLLAMQIWLARLMLTKDEEDMNRRHWPYYDFILLYDIFLSGGCILAFWRTFYFLQLIKGIGATVISIGKCVSKVYNYLAVMAIVMASFSIGINLIVQPYLGTKSVDGDGITSTMGQHFSTIPMAIRYLYWSFYGYLDPSSYPIVVGNAGEDHREVRSQIVSAATEGIVMIYHVIIVITLLNLMISLLVKKADEVLDNEDMEYKYTRICIYSEFYEDSIAVPPPFNILLCLQHIILKLFKKDYKLYLPGVYHHKDTVSPDPNFLKRERDVYEFLLRTIFYRFIATKECTYRTVYRTELDKDKKPGIPAKTLYMNTKLIVPRRHTA